jgi:hypothetical protein
MTWRRIRKCAVAALAEALRAIKRPTAKTERIAFSHVGVLRKIYQPTMEGANRLARKADLGSAVRRHH